MKHILPLQKLSEKRQNDTKQAILSNYHREANHIYSTGVIVFIGMILISQFVRSALPHSNKTITQGKQNNDASSFQSVEKVTARLARVMNAIVLQNEWHQKSIIMKHVMAEAYDVQNAFLFDSMNETSVLKITKAMKTIRLLEVQAMKLNRSITDLTEFVFYNEDTFPKPSIINTLFSHSISDIDMEEFLEIALYMMPSYGNLIKVLKLPVSNFNDILDVTQIYTFNMHAFFLKDEFQLFYDSIHFFVNSSESLNSLIDYIGKYQQITDHNYLRNLTKHLEILLPFATIVDSFLNRADRKSITEKLDGVNRLISINVKPSNKQALIGFPRRSEDIKNCMVDFNDESVREMLNGGKSLNELKSLLLPVQNFNTKVAELEQLWTKTARVNYSNLIFSSLTTLKKINALKPISILESLSKVNETLKKLKPNPDVTNSDLNEFKQLLQNLSRFSIDWKEFLDLKEQLFKLKVKCAWLFRRVKNFTDEEKIAEFKKEFLLGEPHAPIINSAVEKVKLLHKQEKNVKRLFSKLTDFKAKFTNETFDYIHKITERTPNEKMVFKTVQNGIQLLNSLSPFVEIELSAIDKFPEFFFAAKTKMDESHKLENDIKSEITRTKGYHRLEKFPYARVITIQLACLQRAMAFFLRRDLQQIFNDFVKNGKMLGEKINSLPHAEKQHIFPGFHYLSCLNISISNFVSETGKLPSKFFTKKYSLKAFGESLSVFYNVQIPPIDFDLITSTLYDLMSTSIGRSQEVSNLKQSLEHLEGLQYAAVCKKMVLAPLLAQADTFFQEFFLKSERETWLLLPIITITFAVLLVFVIVLLFLRHKTIKAGKHISQEKNEHQLKI